MSSSDQQYMNDDDDENASSTTTTNSQSEPFEHHLGDLSHLEHLQPSVSSQQQQHQKSSHHHYFNLEDDEDTEEEDQDAEGTGQLKGSHNSPFNPKCRIPLPDFTLGYNGALLQHLDTGTFIRRRNERERTRVRNVNEGFERLRAHLPPIYATPITGPGGSTQTRERKPVESRRLSKVETLRLAIAYIKQLQEALSSC